jgi:hypothetical protein
VGRSTFGGSPHKNSPGKVCTAAKYLQADLGSAKTVRLENKKNLEKQWLLEGRSLYLI